MIDSSKPSLVKFVSYHSNSKASSTKEPAVKTCLLSVQDPQFRPFGHIACMFGPSYVSLWINAPSSRVHFKPAMFWCCRFRCPPVIYYLHDTWAYILHTRLERGLFRSSPWLPYCPRFDHCRLRLFSIVNRLGPLAACIRFQ